MTTDLTFLVRPRRWRTRVGVAVVRLDRTPWAGHLERAARVAAARARDLRAELLELADELDVEARREAIRDSGCHAPPRPAAMPDLPIPRARPGLAGLYETQDELLEALDREIERGIVGPEGDR